MNPHDNFDQWDRAVLTLQQQRDAALAEIAQRQADLLLTAQAHCEILATYEADLALARQEAAAAQAEATDDSVEYWKAYAEGCLHSSAELLSAYTTSQDALARLQQELVVEREKHDEESYNDAIGAVTRLQQERDALLVKLDQVRHRSEIETVACVEMRAERDAMEQEREGLLAALRLVEWTLDEWDDMACPWCESNKPNHATNCPRQLVLAAAASCPPGTGGADRDSRGAPHGTERTP